MTGFGQAVDAALEACVVPGFSRIGLAVRARLLPEFTAGDPPAIDGKTVVITGATSGIGYAAAVALARRGAAVHFLARDRGRAERARQGIAAESGSRAISYGLADLEDLATVRAFASDFRATHDRLDVLIHNAGAIHPQFRTDAAGTELTVLGQVAAPFLLTRLLMPALLAAAPARVITVSSGGMYTQRLDLATLQMPRSRYRGVTAYAKAKRAQVALSREWARRLAGTGVAFHAMHPGWVNTPGIAAYLPGFHRLTRPILLTPEQGADTIVWLATMPPDRLGSGRFWHDRRPRPEHPLSWTHEQDPGAARKLWDDLAAATAPGTPKPARAEPDSVAAEHDIRARGTDDAGRRRIGPPASRSDGLCPFQPAVGPLVRRAERGRAARRGVTRTAPAVRRCAAALLAAVALRCLPATVYWGSCAAGPLCWPGPAPAGST